MERAEDLYYITNVVGDGNCGIYSIKHGGDELASQSDTWRFPDSVGNFKIRWKDALRFRRELHDFIMSIETQFYSTDTCPIFGWQGKCDSVALYYGKRRGKMHSYLKDFLKKLWDPRYFRQLIGRHIGDLSRWLNTTNHIPLFALFLKCTIFVYSKEKTPRKPGHYTDQTFIAFYCHDNKVQVGIFWKKVVAPFPGSLLMYFKNKHYQRCRLHHGVPLSSFKLVDYNHDNDKLLHGGHVDLCDTSTSSEDTSTQRKVTVNSSKQSSSTDDSSDSPAKSTKSVSSDSNRSHLSFDTKKGKKRLKLKTTKIEHDPPIPMSERKKPPEQLYNLPAGTPDKSTENLDSDDPSVQSPFKNLKSPKRIFGTE